MFKFNQLDDDRKKEFKSEISKCIAIFGGLNFFLKEIEKLRYTKPNPLINNGCKYNKSIIRLSWNKIVFKNKVILLMDSNYDIGGNLMPLSEDKNFKTKLNLLKSLKPLKFDLSVKNSSDTNLSFPVFSILDSQETKFTPLFVILFLASVGELKKAIRSYTT